MSKGWTFSLAIFLVLGGAPFIATPEAAAFTDAGPTPAEPSLIWVPVKGFVAKPAEIFEGPGPDNPVVLIAPRGADLEFLATQGDWHEVIAVVGGEPAHGWVKHDSVVVDLSTFAGPSTLSGRVTTTVNIRAGPGTSHERLGQLKNDDEVSLIGTSGDWYQVEASVAGQSVTGWVKHDFVVVDVQDEHGVVVAAEPQAPPPIQPSLPPPIGTWGLPGPYGFPTVPTIPSQPGYMGAPGYGDIAPAAGPDGGQILYAGYSRLFRPVKDLIAQGQFDEALELYDKQAFVERQTSEDKTKPFGPDDASPGSREVTVDITGFLGMLERGSMAIDRGDVAGAIEQFSRAEEEITERKKKSGGVMASVERAMGSLAEILGGNEEVTPYRGEGFERILMLNYKTIGYLLQGDRKAYNVTRRAIDWQNLEKRRFEERLRQAQAEVTKLETEQKQRGREPGAYGARETVSRQYAAHDAKAESVASAYVNPFGYYVAGMVQEFESYGDPSLRDNARISYEKALELNPRCEMLRQAVMELSEPVMQSDTKLLHVVVADSFAPEKRTLVYGMQVQDMVIPVKLPIYEPAPSRVRRIEVQSPEGETLGTLEPLADIEAIALRHQKDSEPFQTLRVTLAVVRTVFEKSLLRQMGQLGQLIADARDATTYPDMRSWLSLPATIQATRLHVPEALDRVKIVTYDGSGQKLAEEEVALDRATHSFVYGRSIDGTLVVHTNERLWIAAS